MSKLDEIQIREAEPSDADGILRCLSAAFAPYQKQYTPAGFNDTVLNLPSLLTRMKEMHVLVACQRAEIVGTVAGAIGAGGESHLRGMAVLPVYHGAGIAARLLGTIEAWLISHSCTRVTLDTTRPLLAAMGFYEKHGYSQSGRVSDFFGMPLIEYVKDLR